MKSAVVLGQLLQSTAKSHMLTLAAEQANRRTSSAPRATPPEASAGPVERSVRVRAPVVQENGNSGCGPDCMNRQSYVHCDAKTCPCGEQCTNR